MGQRISSKEKVEKGGDECVLEVNPGTPVTPTEHKAELHPRPDEMSVAIGEGGSGQEDKGQEKTKKKRLKKRRFRKLASFFCCLPRPKSTRVQNEQVEQVEVDQDAYAVPSRRPSDGKLQMSPNHLQLDCEEITMIEEYICCKYDIGKKIGKGGFGYVFEGTRCKDGLSVAMKIVNKTKHVQYISLPDYPRPIPLEVALTVMANQGPNSDHIIKLLDWQDRVDHYIMVLERPSPCINMHLLWKDHGKLFSEEVARLFMWQVIDAAAVCFSRGVFHRDIKMPNLLVNTETLEVKLIDFGCGDLFKSSSYNTYAGTSTYCPPEYTENGEYHGKEATVWSLGVLLFKMITSLFPDSIDISLLDADVWFQPGISYDCCHFLRACLKSNPAQRLHLEEMLFHDWFKVLH